jgi:hypothetical protein
VVVSAAEVVAESLKGSRAGALNRADRAAEYLGSLRLGEVVEESEDQRRSLARCESTQRSVEGVLVVYLLEGQEGGTIYRLEVDAAGQLGPLHRVPFGCRDREIGRDAARIGCGIRHPAHPRPAARYLEQALLDDVLGDGLVPHDEGDGAKQVTGRALHEGVEAVVPTPGSAAHARARLIVVTTQLSPQATKRLPRVAKSLLAHPLPATVAELSPAGDEATFTELVL